MQDLKKKPNILIFFCDQLRLDLLGCYGGRLVRTPNIDALARDSIVFDRAYTPTAVCSPARASLLTGLYPHSHHMYTNSSRRYSYCQHLRADLNMLQDWVDEETDYESAYFGKWHIGPIEDLFRSRFHHTKKPYEGGPGFLKSSMWHPSVGLGKLIDSFVDGNAGTLDVPMAGFPDVAAARYTEEFLQGRDVNRPFIVFCAFPGPHEPWMVPKEFGIRYDPADIPMWPNRHDSFEGKPINQKKLSLFEKSPNSFIYRKGGDKGLQELLACCFSYIELIDSMVGEVISTLKKKGIYENTAIVFTTDHGDMAGAHGYLSKGSYMYDEIYRIPLLLKTAEKFKPKRIQAPVHLMDLTATFMNMMSGKEQHTMGTHTLHGQSLLPLISEKIEWPRKVHFAEYHGDWYGHYSSRMVTDGQWKLVWNFSDLCEFYDLANDPGELTNLFYDSHYRDIRNQYFSILVNEARRLEDGQTYMQIPEVEDQMIDRCK